MLGNRTTYTLLKKLGSFITRDKLSSFTRPWHSSGQAGEDKESSSSGSEELGDDN
jgi:hypothetical protein